MPKRITPLSDIQVKCAKAKVTDYKLADGGGHWFSQYPFVPCTNLFGSYLIGLISTTNCVSLW